MPMLRFSNCGVFLRQKTAAMSALELKNEILRMVVETDDPNVLERLVALFKELLKREDWSEPVSEAEAQKIETGAAEAKAGKVIPIEQVFAKASTILQRQAV
jgi:predicted transcriptional regulator